MNNQEDLQTSMAELPEVAWTEKMKLVNWKGFWVRAGSMKAVLAIETQFEPLPSDIILASFPKTGTTWLKALTSTILHYHDSRQGSQLQDDDPLLTQNPHQVIPFLEFECFGECPTFDIKAMPFSRKVFTTHLPYSILPQKIKSSGCKIVYITRNPMDTFISGWFFTKISNSDFTMEKAFEGFFGGVTPAGPYFDHVLEYWRACNEDKGVLFLTYEELKQEPYKHVKRLAEFLGCSLDPSEIEQVVWRCSYERQSSMAVNKDTTKFHRSGLNFGSFFRQGTVGDSKNYMTQDMVEQLREIAEQKWKGSGLKFRTVDEILVPSPTDMLQQQLSSSR